MATISTPVRQPFGILDDSKLRNLQSIKNRQNAITPNSLPSLKRRAPSPELSDSENVDPAAYDLSAKRKRAFFDDDVSVAKQQNIIRTKIVPSSKIYTTPKPSPIYTPRAEASVKPLITPLSAPVTAAGRSPPRTKSVKSVPRRRFAPPNVPVASPTLSLAAALKGTLAHGKRSSRPSTRRAPSRISEVQPKSWDFAIFEESEEQQDYRMSEWTMTQSSAALEISDDEGKGKSFNRPDIKDDKGKENIDPNEMLSVSAPAPIAVVVETVEQSDVMDTKEPRTPLGDLNASKFYGEGLNATSVELVHDDDEEEAEAEQLETTKPAEFTFEAPRKLSPQVEDIVSIPEWAQRTTLVFDDCSDDAASVPLPDVDAEEASIDIWESESAKGENDQYQQNEEQGNCIVVEEGETISLSAHCLSEL